MPPPAALAHTGPTVLKFTLLRKAYVMESDDSEQLGKLAAELCEMLNGDWSVSCLQHYCWRPQCCQGHSRQVAVQRICSIITEASIDALGVDIPACNRWYTFVEHLSRQAGGMLCHRVLSRTLMRAASEEDMPDSDDDTVDSWRRMVSKRLRTAVEMMSDQPSSSQTLAISCIASAPLDRLSARVQALR